MEAFACHEFVRDPEAVDSLPRDALSILYLTPRRNGRGKVGTTANLNSTKCQRNERGKATAGDRCCTAVLTLQALVALGLLELLLGLLFLQMSLLSQVPLVVADDFPHVLEVVFGVLVLLLVGVSFENVDDLGARVVADGFAIVAVGPSRRGGVVGLEPLLEIAGCHVDELVELFDHIGVGFRHFEERG